MGTSLRIRHGQPHAAPSGTASRERAEQVGTANKGQGLQVHTGGCCEMHAARRYDHQGYSWLVTSVGTAASPALIWSTRSSARRRWIPCCGRTTPGSAPTTTTTPTPTIWTVITSGARWIQRLSTGSTLFSPLCVLLLRQLFIISILALFSLKPAYFITLLFKARDRLAVCRSILATVLPCWYLFSCLYAAGGAWLWMKMWLMPYLGFNFWLSTYTYFHHKAADIKWHRSEGWNKAEAQLFGTVHVDYHPIIEFLHFDINWHIPHHVTVKIPWYNLRRATYALMRKYGDKLHTVEMSLSLWKEVTTHCHVWDEKDAYKKFEMWK